jgi:hypothetical protein
MRTLVKGVNLRNKYNENLEIENNIMKIENINKENEENKLIKSNVEEKSNYF